MKRPYLLALIATLLAGVALGYIGQRANRPLPEHIAPPRVCTYDV